VAHIHKGVWHNAVTLGGDCTYVNVTRKNPREGATNERTAGRIERVSAQRPYVGYVDLKERDNRVLELTL
jgi:hypothetical protein